MIDHGLRGRERETKVTALRSKTWGQSDGGVIE